MPLRPAISSQSLGLPGRHALFPKLRAASDAGFQGVEIFFEDLNVLASVYVQERLEDHGATETEQRQSGEPGAGDLLRAADDLRGWCEQIGLEIICLQPFQNYDGLKSKIAHGKQLARFKLWLQLCRKLRTRIILMPSNTLTAEELDESSIVSALQEAADLAASEQPPVQIAYEALAWGTSVNTWEQSYTHVLKADRTNLGICIDTFNLAGKVYGDPTSPNGKTLHAEEEFGESLTGLKKAVDINKILYVQLVDAERVDPPLSANHPWHNEDHPARMTWSRNARVFAFEQEGYLPVGTVVEILVNDLRYEGWVSMEVFHRDLSEEKNVLPADFARRGMESWRNLLRHLGKEA